MGEICEKPSNGSPGREDEPRGRPSSSGSQGWARGPRQWSRPGFYPPEPSFQVQLMELRRRFRRTHDAGQWDHPMQRLPDKLHTYDLARALGVPVPRMHGPWYDAQDIPFASLPPAVVLKAPRGAGSHAVLPVVRTDDGRYSLVSRPERWTVAGLVDELRRRESSGKARGGWFAEDFIGDPGQGMPRDIKVYAFYGEIGHVMVRDVGSHGVAATVSRTYYDEHGGLLEDLVPETSPRTVEPPRDLDAVCRLAARLSVAVSLPFVRVDLYETEAGLVLGELTLAPGGQQVYRVEHDRRLGQLWEDAKNRVEIDHLRDIAEVRISELAERRSRQLQPSLR